MIMSTAIPTSPPRSARSSRSGHRRERARRHSILCNAVHSAPGIPKSARYEPLPKRGIATACSPRRSRPCATSNRSGTRTTRPTVKCPPSLHRHGRGPARPLRQCGSRPGEVSPPLGRRKPEGDDPNAASDRGRADGPRSLQEPRWFSITRNRLRSGRLQALSLRDTLEFGTI
jgi:hypothetical protein